MKIPFIKPGQDLGAVLVQALGEERKSLRDRDIVAVASKVASVSEQRIVALDEVKVTVRSKRIARKWRIDERVAALVIEEADQIIGGVPGFVLTLKSGVLTANAGIDMKNAPLGTAVLWPNDPDASADAVRRSLEDRFHVHLGVIIVDSRVTPLRLGTVGLAMGVSWVLPVRDERGSRDLYGRKAKVTQVNVVDDIASSAHLLMGETNERIGAVVVRNAPIVLQNSARSRQALIPIRKCLIASNLAA